MLRDEIPLDQLRVPKLAELLAWWNARRGSHALPGRADFEVSDLKPWLGNIHLIDVEDGGAEFRYRVYGSNLARYFGHDFTGKTTAIARPEARELVRSEYRTVCSERRPVLVQRARSVLGKDTPVVRLILPLASDGATVDKLIVCSYPILAGKAAT